MSKKRAFVKYTGKGKIIPGSLILTAGSYPKDGLYQEVPTDLCCIDTAQYYRVAGCERMEYHVIKYTGTDILTQGTIVSNNTPECWYIDSVATGPADVGTVSAVWTTTGECGVCTVQAINAVDWTVRNLDVDRYRNGDPIPEVTDPAEWAALTTGAWCYYDNDPANGAIYGKLYNWYAVNDPRGLAPIGYHVPTYNEINDLRSFLGGGPAAGGKMKEAGTSHWLTPNTGADNTSGWTGLPGGIRQNVSGAFTSITEYGNWWSSDTILTNAYGIALEYNNATMNISTGDKTIGCAVRLIRD